MDIAHSGEIQQEIQVLTMTLFALVTALIASGNLEDMAGDACEVCGDGLYSLKSKREEGKAENVAVHVHTSTRAYVTSFRS